MLQFPYQLALLGSGLFLIFLSIFYFPKKQQLSLWLLLAGAFIVRVFMAQLDPYLNPWDEKFHALVAKSMADNPLKPMLYTNPVLPYDFTNWTRNHIWLHKQPLFLWQIALFFKLFGVNEFVLRLPSVIMTTGIVFFIASIGKLLVNAKAGFYGAMLFALSYFCLELCSGIMGMDHNDTAFAFYATASIWAWANYQTSGKRWWLVGIGVFSGCAILVKWLTGLLVYSGWGLSVILKKHTRFKWRAYTDMAISLAISMVVFLPWQAYITVSFPQESAHEYAYNTKHVFEVVEGHAGTIWHYLETMPVVYSPVTAYLVPLALVFLFLQLKTNVYRIAIFTYILFVYFFFSIVVTTKIQNYVFVVAPLIFLGFGSLLYALEIFLTKHLKTGKAGQFLFLAAFFLLAWFTFSFDRIWFNHFEKNAFGIGNYRSVRAYNALVYKRLPGLLWGEDRVVFNVRSLEHIDLMFYTNLTAYDYMPSPEDIRYLRERGLKIAVFDHDDLPDYIRQDSDIYKIGERLM